MLRGWHANNGVVLGNPRLGFVCTGQTVDGQPGLEGYYKEWDHERSPPTNACNSRPPSDVRRFELILRLGFRKPRGPKSASRKSCATTRWNTLHRSCRKRLQCSAPTRAATSPALRRGWWECKPSTMSHRFWVG